MSALRPDVKEIAKDRWDRILPAAGVPKEWLGKKMGPCPLCGGNTRFYMKNLVEGRGWCHKCGRIDGWTVLMVHLGENFAGAADWVRRWAGGSAAAVERQLPPPTQKAERSPDELRAKYLHLWEQAKPVVLGSSTPGALYVQHRAPGLAGQLCNVREHAALEYWVVDEHNKFKLLGKFPALLGLVQGPDGAVLNVWRIYLTKEGRKANVPEAKKAAGKFLGVGGAVRIFEPVDGRIGVTEGMEGAWAAMLFSGTPTWSCCNAWGIRTFEVPPGLGIRHVTIFGDNDKPDELGRRAGNDATRALRDRLRAQGFQTLIVMPASTRHDLADIVKAQAERAAA